MPKVRAQCSVHLMPRPRTEDVKNKVMTGEEYPLRLLADASNQTGVKSSAEKESCSTWNRKTEDEEIQSATPLLERLSSGQTRRLKPNFGKFRNSLRKFNCFKSQKEEETPMMHVPRHRSIDIGVGLARRMSLFIFTKKTVSVHPYHPYTPSQTTRKIYVFSEDKH